MHRRVPVMMGWRFPVFPMKLPDAIIVATARANGLTILTADDHFRKLKSPWNVRFFRTL